MKEKLKLTEVWFKFVLLFVFGGFYILAVPYPSESKQFPQLLAAISLVLTVIALGLDFLRAQVMEGEIGDVDDTELKVVDAATRAARRRRFYLAWAILLVATGAGFLGGFLLSTIILFGGFVLASGREHLVKNLIIAVAMTVVVYFIFGRIMAVPLLDGVLW